MGSLVRRSVATLYSHLVTRPTGRAVRLAIETQLAEVGDTSCSLIDLSEVTVLDFSCADEVVAKLLSRYLDEGRPREAFFVFQGVSERHRQPIEAVLDRHRLAAVAEGGGGGYEFIGVHSRAEGRAWTRVEETGSLRGGDVPRVFSAEEDLNALDNLIRRRLVFRTLAGDVIALSRLVRDLPLS